MEQVIRPPDALVHLFSLFMQPSVKFGIQLAVLPEKIIKKLLP
jgi:hypothetical protein